MNNQLQIEIENSRKNIEQPTSGDCFDLCHAYRSCSDAMKCVEPAGVNKHNCRYSAKLEAGICYYGKNAVGFDKNVYAEFCSKVSTLSKEEKTAFDNYVIAYVKIRKEINLRMEYSEHYETLKNIGLLEIHDNKKQFLNRMKAEDLREIIKANSDDKMPKLGRTKAELVDFLLNSMPDAVNKLYGNSVYISITDKYYKYYFEYYYDYIKNNG